MLHRTSFLDLLCIFKLGDQTYMHCLKGHITVVRLFLSPFFSLFLVISSLVGIAVVFSIPSEHWAFKNLRNFRNRDVINVLFLFFFLSLFSLFFHLHSNCSILLVPLLLTGYSICSCSYTVLGNMGFACVLPLFCTGSE